MGPGIETVLPDPAPGAEAGFTLIELLVTTAILAILAVGAALSLPRSQGPEQQDMVLFQKQVENQQLLAITGGQSRGLKITAEGLQLALRQDQGWQISPRVQRWQSPVRFATQAPQYRGADTPEIFFLATGESTAFDITFGRRQHCRGSGEGVLACSSR